MSYLLLDSDYTVLSEIDEYDSMIWTDRHREYGDFELYGRPDLFLSSGVAAWRYLMSRDSDRAMIIEDLSISTDIDQGPKMTVTGRSLESILCRRVIWPPATVDGSLDDCVFKLVNDHFINPKDPNRRVDNMVYVRSSDPYITETHATIQFAGEYVYDAIHAICDVYNLGFKMALIGGQLVFTLYKGFDRSFNQDILPWVVFSPDFDNIAGTSYSRKTSDSASFAYVAGKDISGEERVTTDVDLGRTGLSRVELFVDASDLRPENDDGTEMSDEDYKSVLEERGLETLCAATPTEYFEGSMVTTGVYVYNRDFFLGDIVQIQNEFSISATSQILEVVHTKDQTGETLIPTFSSPEFN